MNVTFCLTSFLLGGTELNAVRTAERLSQRGVSLRAAVINDEGPLRERWRDAGIPVDAYPTPSLASLAGVRQCARLARDLRKAPVHVLHAHSAWANAFGVAAARLAGVPCIISSRRWGVRDLGGSLGTANTAAYRLSHRVLANSQAVADLVRSEDRIRADRIVVLPNFLGADGFQAPSDDWIREFRRSVDADDDHRLVVSVGRLVPDKDHATLIRAFAEVVPGRPEWLLVLVGDGRLKEDCMALAAELGIRESVRFAGSRPQHPSPFWAADLGAHSSVSEGFPNAIVEAMGAGRAVVSTTAGGCVDAVTDGETGLLVPPSDPGALGRVMARLMDDPVARASMGREARLVAEREFGEDAVMDRLVEIYETVLGGSR